MKILTKYILKAIAGPMLFGFFAFLSMLMGFAFIGILRHSGNYNLSFFLIVKLLALQMPEYVTQTAPVAVLLGTLLGLGQLTSHSETIAMRASGFDFVQLVIPVMIIGLTLSIGGVALNEYVVPASLRAYQKTEDAASREVKTTVLHHFSYDSHDGEQLKKRIYAEQFNPVSASLHRVTIEEYDHGQLTRIILTAKMEWDGQGWFFTKGSIYQINTDNFYPMKVDRGYIKYDLNLTPDEIKHYDEDVEQKSITGLWKYIQKHTRPDSKERQSFLVDWHMKFAIPFASLVLAILGTPLALQPQRRTSAAGFGLCIVFIILWYAFMGVGSYLGRAGMVTPFFGAWLPNFVLAGYGVYIFVKVKI
ncbi:MAG: LptF/LptG family permease [Bacillota bacterium]|jgi:lipopolysaccharide export system permease protein